MNRRSFFFLFFVLGISEFSFAQHKGITFQAVIKKADGSRPNVNGLKVVAQILDPVNKCVLRDEEHANKKITDGYINLVLGESSATTLAVRNPSPILTIGEVLDNKTTRSNLKCVDLANNIIASGQNYIPSNLHGRVLRLRLMIDGEEIAADFNMRATGFAVNSELLNSKSDTDFINVNGSKGVDQASLESIFERFTKLDAILNVFGASGTTAGINITGNASTATIAANVSGVVDIAHGGTGASAAAGARSNLGLGSLATMTPTGTADSTTYLRGDGTWQPVGGGAVSSVAGRTGAVTLSTSDISGLESLATKTTSGTANNTTFLRGDGAWTSLGSAASSNVGTTAGTVAAGDDSRLVGAIQNAGTSAATNIVSISAGLDADKSMSATAGQMYVSTDLQKIYRYDGTTWVVVAAAGGVAGAISDINAGTGLAGGGSSGSVTLGLKNIANNMVLANISGASAAPAEVSISAMIDAMTGASTQGGILYRNASGWQMLSPGAGGQYLQTQGGGANPIWANGPTTVTNFTGSLSGDVSGTQAATSVNKIKNIPVDVTGVAEGKYLKYSAGSWIPAIVGVNDLVSSVTGNTQFTTASCLSHQTLTWSSLSDSFACQDISVAHTQVSGLGGLATKSAVDLSGSEATGVIDSARLPASVKYWNSAVGGINYAGGKVGIGTATPATTLDVNGPIKVGDSSVTCDTSTEGQLKYDYGLRTMQFCNGYLWVTISAPDVQSFSASGTWTKPSGIGATATTKIQCWGGGGGGGGAISTASAGGGGGGGAYNEVFVSTATLPATQSVVIGNGGTAGSTAGTAGGAGGNSTFGAFLTAYGGGGGGGHSNAAAFPGTGGGGGGTLSAGSVGVTTGGNGSPGGAGGDGGGGRGGGNYGSPNLSCEDGLNDFGGAGGGNAEAGCSAVYGGGGGGGADFFSSSLRAGGLSTYGGQGGASGSLTTAAVAGGVPGGGGGGGNSYDVGAARAGAAGGKGMCIVTTYR